MEKVNVTSLITTYTSQHAWLHSTCKKFKIYIRTGQNIHNMILHLMSLTLSGFT